MKLHLAPRNKLVQLKYKDPNLASRIRILQSKYKNQNLAVKVQEAELQSKCKKLNLAVTLSTRRQNPAAISRILLFAKSRILQQEAQCY